MVARFGGRLVSSGELARLLDDAAQPGRPFVDTVTVEEDLHLVLPPGTDLHFGNHSCDPNLWLTGPYTLATRRAITSGEETTVDYATNSGIAGFTLACACGSDQCRGTVTGDDWRRPELQERYGRHWTPALRRRIAAHRQPG